MSAHSHRGERCRPGLAVGQRGGVGQRVPQHRALIVRVRIGARRSAMNDIVAIRLDERHVDPVERGARHQADAGARVLTRLCPVVRAAARPL